MFFIFNIGLTNMMSNESPLAASGIRNVLNPVYVKYGLLLVIGVIGTVYHLWFAWTYGLTMNRHILFHFGMMTIALLVSSVRPRYEGLSIIKKLDNFLIIPVETVAAVGVSVYLWIHFERLTISSIGVYSDMDFYVGIITILLVLELVRRAYGWILTIVGTVGLVYALFGYYFPGFLSHTGVPLRRLVTATTVQFTGVFGTILQVSATYIVIFIIFAGFLEAYGALQYFIKLGAGVGTRVKSGITQTAVIASIGFGSINGSAAANSATTGALTIPLMKDRGVNRNTAAAIESVASSGGQIMPPIMGAAAFIMAEFTGTSYLHIVKIGLLPALLFYLTVVCAVYLLTVKEGAVIRTGEDEGSEIEKKLGSELSIGNQSEVDKIAIGSEPGGNSRFNDTDTTPLWGRLMSGLYLWIPIGILVYSLFLLDFGAVYSGSLATVATVPVAFGQTLLLSANRKQAVVEFVGDTFDACRLGIENAAPIAMATAVLGLFIGTLNLTALTQVITQSLVSISGGSLFLLLVVAMISAILFGLGLPTVAAYVLAVILIAPPLTEAGIRLETAHFYVFYFAILSALTPPVAIACIITSKISGGDFWRTSYKSILIGMPLFLLPYVFVVNDEILYWDATRTPLLFVLLLIGLVSISIAAINRFGGPLTPMKRIGLLVVSFGVLYFPVLPTGTVDPITGQMMLAALLLLGLGHNQVQRAITKVL